MEQETQNLAACFDPEAQPESWFPASDLRIQHFHRRCHLQIRLEKSLRVEAQYLYSTDYEGDWVAALVEFNMVPHWSFFVSDMYNLDETEANSFTKTNYYSAGFSYLKNRTRIQLSYGRNRAGYVCSGGACRYMPAYTGLNLVITSSF